MGCSKCLLPFPTEKFGEKADYSNFKRTEWKKRTNDHHRSEAKKCRSSVTKNEQTEVERRSGIRYSCLLELPYFNAPRMCIVDPMHNLLLGISKMMVELWNSSGILSEKDLAAIQSRVDSFLYVLVGLVAFLQRYLHPSLVSLQNSGKIGLYTLLLMP